MTTDLSISKQKVLVVEDEALMRDILRSLLERAGYEVFTADSGEAALRILNQADISVTLTDIRMPGIDGLSLLERIKEIDTNASVIVMTAYSSVDSAVAALRKGAFDYVTKPFVNDDLLRRCANAITQRNLVRENRALRRELNKKYGFSEIIGSDSTLSGVMDIVSKVASANAPVLITGESGTGKELIARAIHFNSERATEPFLAINCGAIPESLLESELFGHSRGAFTGATTDKKGIFRAARGGTILLDEIGEMPASLQVKLLRAIEERTVKPLGESDPIRFDARIIAATNRDAESEVSAGRFREDLFYRLNVIEIKLPPLRERRDDIPKLARHFVSRIAAANAAIEKPINDKTMAALLEYDWPGNVRELENALERAFLLSGEEIMPEDLPERVRRTANREHKGIDGARLTLEELERRYLLETLSAFGNDKAAAARSLGIDLSTLYRKLKRYEDL